MIQQLQQIFYSITKSLEVLYVIEGNKPCARIMVFEDELGKVINFFKKREINHAISDFKAAKQNVQSEFYSDKSMKIPKNSSEKGYFFVYISKNEKTAQKAKIMEGKNNHMGLGLTLGYPECCCVFFQKNFNEKNTDLTLKILENSNGYEFPFYNNIAARHFDVSLLGHFPHSFECRQSIDIAKNNFKIMQKYSEPLSEMFSGILRGAVLYTMGEGIFLLKKCERINNEIIYGEVLSTAKSKLYFLLNSNKTLKIIDKNNIVVGDANLSGSQYGIMSFIKS